MQRVDSMKMLINIGIHSHPHIVTYYHIPMFISHRIHIWYIYHHLPSFTTKKSTIHVGKSTMLSHVNHSGFVTYLFPPGENSTVFHPTRTLQNPPWKQNHSWDLLSDVHPQKPTSTGAGWLCEVSGFFSFLLWNDFGVLFTISFQVPKMEGFLNLIRLVWGWVFPYISLTYSLYRWVPPFWVPAMFGKLLVWLHYHWR